MIGQLELLESVNRLIDSGFPRFTVITGQTGQGKQTLAKHICKRLNYPFIISEIKVDDLRNIIELSYKQTEPIVYIIPNADKMSLGAKNSLLKVIEEPPNNAYFIMTLQTIENTLNTIKSRCVELKMNNYSEAELIQFIDKSNINVTSDEKSIILKICENYHEIVQVYKYGIIDFYEYVKKVVDNIYKVQSANSFKIADKLSLKNEEDKYDLILFLRTFKIICMEKLMQLIDEEPTEEFRNYAQNISITCDTINQLSITGINKQSLLDVWILDIRKVWR